MSNERFPEISNFADDNIPFTNKFNEAVLRIIYNNYIQYLGLLLANDRSFCNHHQIIQN